MLVAPVAPANVPRSDGMVICGYCGGCGQQWDTVRLVLVKCGGCFGRGFIKAGPFF